MIRPAREGIEVYVCVEPVDMRKQSNGLATLVQAQLEMNPQRCPIRGLGYNLPAKITDIGGAQKLWVLSWKTGHAGQTFKMIVRGNKFDIVFSGAGVDDGIGKDQLV